MQAATGVQAGGQRSASRAPAVVLAVVTAGNFVVSLDTTVNVALPSMTEALDAPIASLQWIIIAYVLTNTGLVLGCGRLADLVGRRRVWVLGFFALAAALLSCGLAGSLWQLVPARAFQAVGAAMALASGGALVTASFPPSQRGRALGIAAMGAAAGGATGPLLGGVLVDAFGWQGVFLGRAPIALAVAAVSVLMLPRGLEPRGSGRFDLIGTALLGLALVCFLLALNRGPLWGWIDPRALSLAAGAMLLLVSFVWWEGRCAAPVIDLRLLRDGQLAAANLSGYLSSLAMFGVWLLLPYYLVDGRGYASVRAGWFLACTPAATALVSPLSGWLADRFGAGWPVLCGLLCEAAALVLIASLGLGSPVWQVALSLIALGAGLGLFSAPNQSIVMGRMPPEALGAGSGMLSMMRTLGIVSGVAVLGAVYAAGLPDTPTGERPAFSIDAFRAAFAVAAGIAMVAALVSIVPAWGRRATR